MAEEELQIDVERRYRSVASRFAQKTLKRRCFEPRANQESGAIQFKIKRHVEQNGLKPQDLL